MDIKYPEKSHSKPKNDNKADEGAKSVEVRAGVAMGSHAPFVAIIVDGEPLRLGLEDAAMMADSIQKCAMTAYGDACFVSYMLAYKGMTSEEAFAELELFQQFRVRKATLDLALSNPVSIPDEPEVG